MIKIEKVVLPSPEQWEAIIRGMRNPKNSWERSDTDWFMPNDEADAENYLAKGDDGLYMLLGENDLNLMNQLATGGPVHAKYRRMIPVYLDITAPLYWWKEFDTYKVGTVANSCSTMHKIQSKRLTFDDFSTEHLTIASLRILEQTIDHINKAIFCFRDFKEKEDWWQIIQLLPSSYNQTRTVMLNYEVLVGIYKWRKNHKLDEWREFCTWIESLPYSELITRPEDANEDKVTVCRCKDCSTCVSMDEIKNTEEYSDVNTELGEALGAIGMCCSTDTFVHADDYCSQAKRKRKEN